MIQSRFSFRFFYLFLVILGIVGYVGMGLMAHAEETFSGILGITATGMQLGMLVLLIVLVFTWLLFRVCPLVTISYDQIRIRKVFNTRTIDRNEVKSLNLLGRTVIAGVESGAIMIILESGETVTLGDYAYRNYAELKLTLKEYYPILVPNRKERIRELDTLRDGPELFSGNHLISFNGLLFYGGSIAFIWMTFALGSPKGFLLLFPFLMIGLLYYAIGRQSYYFRIDAQALTVKNHLFFWVEREYLLDDIEQAIIEQPHKFSITLQLITSDFTARQFGAGSLRTKTWKNLIVKIRGSGIPVRNEVV